MTGRGIDQVLPHPSDPRICESHLNSALDYVALAERANGPIRKPVDFDYVWGDAREVFARMRPDARIVNLETSVTTSETCVPKGINYRMNPKNLPCLTAAGIDCCVLSNNHVLDWGRPGLIETLEALESAGIKTAGAGRNAAEAGAPAVIEVPGKGRVLVFAYGSPTSGIPWDWAAGVDRPGINLIGDLTQRTVARIATSVRSAKRPGDIAVVSLHCGGNWGYRVSNRETDFAHRLIDDAAADVVHGHSSHHAKGIEVHDGKPILYGCGDFLTDYEGIEGYETYRDDLALMYFLRLTVDRGRLARLGMVPLQIRNFRLNRASPEDVEWLRAMFTREGNRFGARAELGLDGTLALAWN